jgi:hypothetical protein
MDDAYNSVRLINQINAWVRGILLYHHATVTIRFIMGYCF